MTNDDIKRFYNINNTPEENKDFVRYDDKSRIQAEAPQHSKDVVNLEYFNNHGGGGGGDTGVNTINDLNLTLGEEIITYDTTDGLTISAMSEIQYGDTNKHQFNSEINIPLIGQNGIVIDSAPDNNKLIIKNENTPASLLTNTNALEGVYGVESNGTTQKIINISSNDSNNTLIQRDENGKARVATPSNTDDGNTIVNINYVNELTKGNIKTIIYDNTTLASHFNEILGFINNENGGNLIDIGFKVGENNITGTRKTVTIDTTNNSLNVVSGDGTIIGAGEFVYARPTTLTTNGQKKKVTFICTNDIELFSTANITLNNFNDINTGIISGKEFGYLQDNIVEIYFNNIPILDVPLEHLVINYYTI